MIGRIAVGCLVCACGRLGFDPTDEVGTATITIPSTVRLGRDIDVTIQLAAARAGIAIQIETTGVATTIMQPAPTDASGTTVATVRATEVGTYELSASLAPEAIPVLVQPGPRLLLDLDENTGSTSVDRVLGLAATLTNGAAWQSGAFGNAISFDGTNDFLTLQRPANTYFDDYIDNTEVTVELYARPTAFNAEWAVMYQLGGCVNHVALGHAADGRPVASIMKDMMPTQVFGASPLSLNQWTHLAVAKTATALILYVSGTEVARVPAPTLWNTGAGIHLIGTSAVDESAFRASCAPTSRDWFEGQLDEVQVFDHAVAPEMIAIDATVAAGT